MLKILRVIPYYEPAYAFGGPARSVSTICRGLAAAGADVSVFTTNRTPDGTLDVPVGEAIDVGGVCTSYFPTTIWHRRFYSPGLAAACRQRIREFDAVHLSTVWTHPGIVASRCCREARVPYVVSPHNALVPRAYRRGYWPKRLYTALFERQVLDNAARIVYTSRLEMEQSGWLGLKAQPIVIPNGIDISSFDALPARGTLRARLGIDQGAPVLLFLGRLHPDKGLDFALPAFRRMREHHPEAHFILVGPDESGYASQISTMVEGLGLDGRVHLTGLLTGEDRLSAFADADLLVLTSRYENFGMAAVEAMVTGTPVLISDQVETWAELAEGGGAFVVPLDEDKVAEAMTTAFEDMTALHRRGEAAREHARRRFNVEGIVSRYMELYEEVASQAGTQGVAARQHS